MTDQTSERIAWHNGEYKPESQVLISFRDAGFIMGDAVFDTARTFGGKLFRIKEHVARLYDSMRSLRLKSGLSQSEMIEISEEVVHRNSHLIEPSTDLWLTQRVSRGTEDGDGNRTPTVIVECAPLPLKQRAPFYRDGIDVIVSPVRRTAPDALTPRAKTHNYLNMVVANQAVGKRAGGAWPILLDHNGNLCEGLGSNIFLVRDGVLMTPREQFVLPGVSRSVTIELARDLGLECIEKDLDHHDAYNADEIFMTSTSLCICPVASYNGMAVREDSIPGPVTEKLLDAYTKLVGFDFVGQYLMHLEGDGGASAF